MVDVSLFILSERCYTCSEWVTSIYYAIGLRKQEELEMNLSYMPEPEVMHSIDELEALPEGQRAEIIDGVLYDMATPSTTHQRLAGVREYWIVDPESRTTIMYVFDNGREESFDLKQYSFDEELRSGIYPDFTIRPANELENR